MKTRKFVLTVALAAFTAAAATTGVVQAEGELAPRIIMPKMRIDMGDTFEQETYDFHFPVRNEGAADLVIEDVTPGCGCTVAKYDEVIPPGGEGTIHLAVEGNEVHGDWSKAATVYCNDPKMPKIAISVAANEIPYINVSPSDRLYLQGRYGETVAHELILTSNEKDLDFVVTDVTSNVDDKITYSFEKGGQPGEWKVTAFKNPKLPTLSTYGSLFIHTNSKNAPVQTVQVQIITKGAITVQPQLVNYGRIKFPMPGESGTPVTKEIDVVKANGDFAIRDVTFNSEYFSAKVEESTGGAYRIAVTFDPPEVTQPRQRELAEMTIHTDDPREPTVTVRLVARAL